MNVSERLARSAVVPVVVLDDAKDAVATAKALLAGGVDVMEITFRTAAAADSIKAVAENCPDMLVGAGTVLTVDQADAAVAAGAKFIVSPGLNPQVVRHCLDKGYPVLPGVVTPSEVEQALSLGLEVVKFFPAEAAGGLAMIKAMSAPYGALRFMPTGGISAGNLESYLSFGKVLACGGSWMVKDSLVKEGRFDTVEELTRQAVKIVHKVRV